MPVLEEVKVTGYSMGDAPGAMSTDFLTEKPREAADEGPEERVTESDSGVIMLGLGDGSVRSIPPATDAARVTENESGLIYSGESGGINESQTGHWTQIMWGSTTASGGDAFDAGAAESPVGTSGRGVYVLSTGDIGPYAQVEPDDADSAGGQASNSLVLTFQGDRLDPAEGSPSINVSDYAITESNDSADTPPFFLKLESVEGDSPASTLPQRQATFKMFSADYAGSGDATEAAAGDESYAYVLIGTPPPADHSGGILVGMGDASVRSISPATDATGVTEHESGLTYSGESGGLNESQVAAIGEMKWDNVAHDKWDNTAPAVEPYVGQGSWGLDRIDPLDDAAGPFFAYDRGFLGGVDVASASDAGYGGGVVVAAGDFDGYRPDMFGHFDLV